MTQRLVRQILNIQSCILQVEARHIISKVHVKKLFVQFYFGLRVSNEGKSAASFCHQVAAWFLNMFCNFYLVKNHKIVKNSTSTKAIKNYHRFRILQNFINFLMYCLTKFKSNKILLNKISHRFPLTKNYLLGERPSLEPYSALMNQGFCD